MTTRDYVLTLNVEYWPPRLWARLLETAASLPAGSDARRECVAAARAVREADEEDRRKELARKARERRAMFPEPRLDGADGFVTGWIEDITR